MRTTIAFALFALFAPLVARAQSNVGRVDGTVLDDNGYPLARVIVTARSRTQIGGPRVTQTNNNGEFHLLGLIPGDFTLRFEAQGLKPVVRENIRVGVNNPVGLDVLM